MPCKVTVNPFRKRITFSLPPPAPTAQIPKYILLSIYHQYFGLLLLGAKAHYHRFGACVFVCPLICFFKVCSFLLFLTSSETAVLPAPAPTASHSQGLIHSGGNFPLIAVAFGSGLWRKTKILHISEEHSILR